MLFKWRKGAARLCLLVPALVYASASSAALQVWDFDSQNQSFSAGANGNSLSLTSSDGNSLTVTGWSNTDYSVNPTGVESGNLVWSQNAAIGVRNETEMSGRARSVDSNTTDSMGGYDMFLLEFDTEVSLAGLDLNWARGGSDAGMTDLSILAWDGLGSDAVDLGGWADILIGNGGGYDVVGNLSDVDLSYFSMDDTSVISSRWLVGAYNPVFGAGGDAGDDAFALASITTMSYMDSELGLNGINQVPVPGTLVLALLGLGLAGLFGRERESAAPA